jgi:large subunit ribosomal protein L22
MARPKPARSADNEAQAVAKVRPHAPRVSPQKLNLVAQLIRGKKVAAALERAGVLAQAHRRTSSKAL